MNQFKDLNISKPPQCFTGDKMSIDRILNRDITVHDYRIADSKVKENTKYLQLQISIDTTMHVVFTGSTMLMDIIKKVDKSKLPFTTRIVKENRRYDFT
ncbi:MAG: hypothetical protein Q8L07_04165 [Sediminibacterium sp.]|nr:hypothetical protein [Sediminibacterium sp.]